MEENLLTNNKDIKPQAAQERITFRSLTTEDIRKISTWRYPEPYALYNEISYEEMVEKNYALVQPEKRHQFTGFFLNDTLLGYINLVEKAEYINFGIGLCPSYCGNGYGQKICLEAIAMAKGRWPQKPLRLEVRSWNQRAISCYQKAGFRIIGETDKVTPLGQGHFIVMEA